MSILKIKCKNLDEENKYDLSIDSVLSDLINFGEKIKFIL